jgi:hypothetical protein
MEIQLTKVNSTNIQAIGYDTETQTLAVQFPNGKVYHYEGVKLDTYTAFRDDESKGTFFAKFIRGKYNSHIYTPPETVQAKAAA